jgi:peroxiredoxin
VTNLRDKPFALIGVNVAGHDAKALKQVADKEKLTWRSFADADGDIAAKWNLSATPTLYLLDPKGMIRHKWVGAPGAKAIDAALDELIKEAEAADKQTRK